ncbi:MAG: class I SAM-dependent methyltransferase [Acetobacteraceae bacterium]|nr:class I SAM-dependent methyltransferase [Acetobacteraceae bacterium]
MELDSSVAADLGDCFQRAQRCSTRLEVLDIALECVGPDGLVCEFGVFEGATIRHITRRLPGRAVYGFDSFEGLPESWRPSFDRGAFSTGGRMPAVQQNVKLVKGWFDDTLPAFCREHQDPVALLHIDCDLYSSTRCVLAHLGRRLRTGSLLVFDEFFNYPGWEQHEFRAFSEFASRHRLRYEYLAYNAEHEQVAVLVTGWG